MRTDRRQAARVLVCAAAIVASCAPMARAQATDQPTAPASVAATAPAFFLTPFFAFGDDLAPGGGAAFTYQWTASASIEAEASLGTDAARSSVSLLYNMPRVGRFVPYVAAGIGVQRDEFETAVADVGFVTRKRTEAAVNIGAGITVPVNTRWSYRADFRWYNPDDEWPESWRAYSGIVFRVRQ